MEVVGLLDRSAGDEQPGVLFDSELTEATNLVEEDTILVYGQAQELDARKTTVTQLWISEIARGSGIIDKKEESQKCQK